MVGHTAPKCPTIAPKNIIVCAGAGVGAGESEGTPFVIPDNSNAAWGAWASQDYDCFQPIVELDDNAIAAILALKGGSGSIYHAFDFEKSVGSIEHSGGITFPLNPTEIARCFTYGDKCPTLLNEHGCGLKSSLAILDPYNKSWKIYIKYVQDGVMKVKSICAPYTSSMILRDETEWPGENKTAENGSYITFPLDKRRFNRLYQKKDEASMKDLHERIKCQLTHMWMKLDEMIEGRIQMFYNGDRLVPFCFGHERLREYVDNITNNEFTLSTGAVVYVQHIVVNSKGKTKLPGSYTFKRAMTANGAYLFKNGRFIESINDDEPARGDLYSRIIGGVPDNHHNGNIILVNMVGTQPTLPPSVPTKNRFQSHELFDELLDKLYEIVKKSFVMSKAEKEAKIADGYAVRTEKSMKVWNPHVIFESEKTFPLGEVRTPQIDLVVTNEDKRELIEFKRGVTPATSDIGQLFMNWALAKKSPENERKTLKPVLILRALSSQDQKISDTIKTYLTILKEEFGFAPEIRNTDDTMLS